jgi:signal transduction histidine kinase
VRTVDSKWTWLWLLLSVAGYLAILFVAVDDNPSVALLVVVPTLIVGVSFGMRAVAAVIPLLYLVTGVALEVVGSGIVDTMRTYWGIPFLLIAAVGLVVGRLHDVQVHLAEEIEHAREVESKLRNTQARLLNTQNSKDSLIASVGHELRTPLTAVLGFAEMLRLGEDAEMDPADREEMVGFIAREASGLSGLIDDLVVAARIEVDRLEISHVQTSLKAQLAQVMESWDVDQLSNIRIKGDGAKADADPARVRQILRNLITNARTYGGESIEITVGVDPEGAFVEVADNGAGLPMSEWERIFEPYHRYHDDPAGPGSGGLGLAVARGLAERMNGTLKYRHDGQQSRFTLHLPASDGAGDQTPPD